MGLKYLKLITSYFKQYLILFKNQISGILMFMVISALFMSCSSTSWVIEEEQATDYNDYELKTTSYYLESNSGISPSHPVLEFNLMAVNTNEYAQRIKMERYIQRYRPRIGYILLGVAGASLSYYAAFSDQLLSKQTDIQRYALIGAGSFLAAFSLINVKPVGEPQKTGETRLLRKTGTELISDTVAVAPYSAQKPRLSISYGENVLVDQQERSFDDDKISINITDEVDAQIFGENPSDDIRVEVSFDTLTSVREIPVASAFEKFVVVLNQITPLRNQPSENAGNILTDLAEGSQLKMIDKEGDWYKVLYGISETWVSADDVRIIWRPSEFTSDLSVVTIPDVPFGSVDVERNIPVFREDAENESALILFNQDYGDAYPERIYADRDVQLIEAYFRRSLGIRDNRIFTLANIENSQVLDRIYSRLLGSFRNPDGHLKVFINGYARIQDSRVYLVGANNQGTANFDVELNELFKSIAELPLKSVTVFADLDFINQSENSDALNELASVITDSIPNSGILFSSRPDQRSGLYTSAEGEHYRHSIFTYYVANAIKRGNIGINDLLNHLQRNVSFTSRKLYDRPQNLLFFGNRDLELYY